MTITDSDAHRSFVDRRKILLEQRQTLPFEARCEQALLSLHPSLQQELRSILRSVSKTAEGASPVSWPASSREVYVRGVERLSNVVSKVTGQPRSLHDCARVECAKTLKARVSAGELAPASAAISLGAVRVLINASYGGCPRHVTDYIKELDKMPKKNKDHRIGSRETYLGCALALGAVSSVFSVAGRFRSIHIALDAALLAFVVSVGIRREELQMLRVGDVTRRTSRSGAECLSIMIKMRKVGRSRVVLIRDERVVDLVASQLGQAKDAPLFRNAGDQRFSYAGLGRALTRLGGLAHGEPGGANIFRSVVARSAGTLQEAQKNLGHMPKEVGGVTKESYRGSRRDQGMLLIDGLGRPAQDSKVT